MGFGSGRFRPDLEPLSEQKAILRANNRKWHVQPGPPIVTIFVRYKHKCKYSDDEGWKGCRCPKHLRWTSDRKHYRVSAHTRSWAQAEKKKREIEDQLAGRTPEVKAEQEHRGLQDCIDISIQDKKNQGITEKVIGKYTRELGRLRGYCEQSRIYTVQGITRELLTGFCATWPTLYPSSYTRAKVRERVRSFLRYCFEAQWIPRIPALPKIKIDEPPTMPLTADEYTAVVGRGLWNGGRSYATRKGPRAFSTHEVVRIGNKRLAHVEESGIAV